MKSFLIIAFLMQGVNEVQIKPGVRLTGMKPEMSFVMPVIDSVYRKWGVEFVVTSGVEGKHSKTSRHYLGFAIDSRTRDFNPSDIPEVQKDLETALGDDFYVEFEGNHFHIQFSPKALTS